MESEYILRLKKEPRTHYDFFWDVVAASHALDVEPAILAYILTIMPGVSDTSRKLSESFSGFYDKILSRYQDIVEVFVPVFFTNNKNVKEFYLWGTKVVWEMKDYPNNLFPSLNSVGSRVTEDLAEIIQDKITFNVTKQV